MSGRTAVPLPRPPIPPHVAARDTARDGMPLIQAWAGSRAVPVGTTVQVCSMDLSPYHHEYHLVLRVAGGPVRLVSTAEYQGGIVRIDHTTILGPGGGWSLPPGAAFTLTAQSLSAQIATVTWAMLEHGSECNHAPYDHVVTGLSEGGGGAAGPWVDASDIVGPTGLGWAPPDRHQLSITPNGQLDFRFVDETATITYGQWVTAQPVDLKHAGRARLQVRHPGASPNQRSAIFVWNRS